MTPKDRPYFVRILTRLAHVHARELTDDVIDAYFEALRPLTVDAVLRATNRAVAECQFFPKPFELRELAREPERPIEPPMTETGEIVYRCATCRDVGVVFQRMIAGDRDHGESCSPCPHCLMGEQERRRWTASDDMGRTVMDAARANDQRLERLIAKVRA